MFPFIIHALTLSFAAAGARPAAPPAVQRLASPTTATRKFGDTIVLSVTSGARTIRTTAVEVRKGGPSTVGSMAASDDVQSTPADGGGDAPHFAPRRSRSMGTRRTTTALVAGDDTTADASSGGQPASSTPTISWMEVVVRPTPAIADAFGGLARRSMVPAALVRASIAVGHALRYELSGCELRYSPRPPAGAPTGTAVVVLGCQKLQLIRR